MNDRTGNPPATSAGDLVRSPLACAFRALRLPTIAAFALLSLSACLLDLEGGPGRVQVHASGTDTLVALTIDAWRHDFAPPLAPGKTSETIELPVSGRLVVSLLGRHEGRDTVVSTRTIDVGVGEFLRLE